uniref:Plastid lipid-associated protein/fibrillin conserved domain-containing protein n=1 Tax=Pseudictyota dubia TaxID=2749911 RepID=A0A7R9VTG5_9STRA|mmetsp:Transcript_22546/g.41987  ORF Transcript_22546/g.41987 Transcript_22546/m.41987 type:complete len:330 (+) Transcript_22546:72-1061(+)
MMYTLVFLAALAVTSSRAFAPVPLFVPRTTTERRSSLSASTITSSPWFVDSSSKDDSVNSNLTTEQLKAQILQLGAALDRGQSYNPTSGDYYKETMEAAKGKIIDLIGAADESNVPKTLDDISGEWELVLTTVKHGIFRSSPFFLAVQEAFGYAEEKEAFGEDKATLFFKLHELQTCSWGVSKIGRVAQQIDPESKYLYSEFDTSIFSLTVIPILGWFKLLPTFGGCVITAAKCEMEEGGVIQMEVDYTTSRPVPGLSGLGEWIWKVKVPVGFIWKLLPWNKGRAASCSVTVKYVDEDFRVVEDKDGDLFVYSRPVVSRELDLVGTNEG